MADQKITELPIKGTSGINLADYLLGIDSAEGYQMLISDLAKKIVESYSGSSLAGSSRTLKNALDTIASNAGGNMATIESGTTASKAYAVGDYMVRNGQLYKVTAAIASGGTITVGTNVTAAAAADDIAGIGNKIGNTAMGTTATTITGAIKEHETDIGNMALNTTATDLTGAINEHEADISTLNGNWPTQAINVTSVSALTARSMFFRTSQNITLGNTGVTLEAYARGIVSVSGVSGSTTGSILAVGYNGKIYSAFIESGNIVNAKVFQ